VAINFPDNPTVGQTFTAANRTWTYNGSAWVGDYSSTGNADTIDGIDSTQFLRSDTGGILTGELTVTGNITTAGHIRSLNGLQIQSSDFISPYEIFSLSDTYTGGSLYGIRYREGSPDVIEFVGGGNVGNILGMDVGHAYLGLSNGRVGIGTTSTASNEKFVVNATDGIYHFAVRDGATLIGGIHANGDILTIDDANNNGILLAATSTKVQGNLDIDADVANQETAENYTSSTFKKIKFGNNHSNSARGPNKIIMHDNGTGWVGGFGIHTDTTSYYTGGWHRFYRTTAVPSTNTTVFEIGSNGFVPPKLSSDPGSPVTGQTYYNTTSNVLRIYNGSVWMNVYDSPVGLTVGNPVTSTTSFTGTAGNIYYIQPGGLGAVVQAEYSGDNFKGTGYGYFKYWSAPDLGAPTVSLYGQGFRWNVLLVEKAGGVWEWLGFSGTYLTFDARSDTTAIGTFGTRAGFRVFFGFAGGHGIYNTGQSVCNWGSSGSAIGAGWDGSTCGSFPSGLRMGVGQDGPPVYTDRGGTWNFWFSF
jgi:hypothetical protein